MVKMPLFEYVKSLYPSVSLSKVLLIGCQHILSTTHAMFRSLYKLGLDPKNVFILGKCYSTSRSVWREMREEGIHVSELSFSFKSHEAFDSQFFSIVSEFLQSTLSCVDLSKFEKVILMDDGGQLLTLSQEIFKGLENVVAIEQTTSGYEKIKYASLQFPVINVARSEAKLIYESPLISEVVIRKSIKRMEKFSLSPQKVLVIGNGAIGSAIYARLKDSYDTFLYDRVSHNESVLDDFLGISDLVIGCTGNTSLPFFKHEILKKGCVLISASSSDRELDAVHLRKGNKDIRTCHDDIEVNGKILLNCGFPINFDGAKNSVAPAKIQLTRALLMSAILQACDMTEFFPGVVSLDIEVQRDIISRYLQIYPRWLRNAEVKVGPPSSCA